MYSVTRHVPCSIRRPDDVLLPLLGDKERIRRDPVGYQSKRMEITWVRGVGKAKRIVSVGLWRRLLRNVVREKHYNRYVTAADRKPFVCNFRSQEQASVGTDKQ